MLNIDLTANYAVGRPGAGAACLFPPPFGRGWRQGCEGKAPILPVGNPRGSNRNEEENAG